MKTAFRFPARLRRCAPAGASAAAAALVLLASSPAQAVTTTFATDPFLGSTAPATPGRQVFAGLEQTLPSFSFATDAFAFVTAAFGVNPTLSVVNAPAAGIPASGANVIVLRDTDNDNNPATPFAAGTAASLIAGQVATDGAGFFIYHNSVLNVNRLVFSANLNDPAADLSVLARIASPSGIDAINALPQFGSANFVAAVPEPSTYAMLGLGLAGIAFVRRRRRN